MKQLLVALLLLVACSTIGCAPKYWYQEGKTFSECYADHLACYRQLETLTTQTQFGSRELKILEDCMRSKGYHLISESHLPYPSKSLPPDRTIHYRLRGLTGAPDEN
jgi:hypothetical protein